MKKRRRVVQPAGVPAAAPFRSADGAAARCAPAARQKWACLPGLAGV